jgi:hypothetical protein
MVRRIQLWLLLLVLVLPGMLVQAKGPLLPLAVVYNGSLYVMNGVPRFEEELPQVLTLVSDVPTDNYRSVWSPDGTKLAYTVGASGSADQALMVWDGTQSIELWRGFFAYDVPLAWTRDGLITFMSPTANEGDPVPVNVYTIAPQAGAVPDLVIEGLSVMFGCGIGTMLPMEGEMWRETMMSGLRPTLALTDYGLIYPAQCGSSISLYRPFSAETVAFTDGNLFDAVVSPDETRLAGLSGGLVIVDLTTLEETRPTTSALPSVVAWGRDGSLYYAAETETRNLLEGLTPEQLAPFTDFYPDGKIGANTVSIYRIAPDGTETLLHEQDAYAVGRMALKETTLVYSTIPNGDAWVKAIVDGTLTLLSLPAESEGYVSPAVHYLALSETGTVLEAGTIPGVLRQVAVSR